MKRILFYTIILVGFSFMTSCGVYGEQCEGVAENKIQNSQES